MADSDAVRARRARRHRDGDHRYCLEGRCSAISGSSAEVDTADLVAQLQRQREDMTTGQDDPRYLLYTCAIQLAEQVRQRPTAAMWRELRMAVAHIADTSKED